MIVEAAAAPAIIWGLAIILRSIPGIIWAMRCPPNSPAFTFPDRSKSRLHPGRDSDAERAGTSDRLD